MDRRGRGWSARHSLLISGKWLIRLYYSVVVRRFSLIEVMAEDEVELATDRMINARQNQIKFKKKKA